MARLQYNRVAIVKLTNLETGKAIEISDLRVTFSINKTSKAGKSSAKVEIYNLAEKTRLLYLQPVMLVLNLKHTLSY